MKLSLCALLLIFQLFYWLNISHETLERRATERSPNVLTFSLLSFPKKKKGKKKDFEIIVLSAYMCVCVCVCVCLSALINSTTISRIFRIICTISIPLEKNPYA